MLNGTRMKVYINAYSVRLHRGESLDSIDQLYMGIKRLTQEECNKIHQELKKKRVI